MASFKSVLSEGLGLLFPKNIYCLCCGDSMEDSRIHGICDVCAEKIDWNTENPYRRDMDLFAFDGLLPCCRYGFYPRRIIAGFKLGSRPYAASSIGLLMAERLAMSGEKGFIVSCVPMHPKKQRKRGFNQSELLARVIARERGEELDTGLLVKVKETASMRKSSGDDRRVLLDDSIELASGAEEKIKGRHVVLVDDVVTTGTTADSCARLLKQGGASKVTVLCFAVSPSYKAMDTQDENDV
ncbi:MAG: ComF family protein [Firmicutes bacterium]|nr:ComF family protein [Bacillota bacterium]